MSSDDNPFDLVVALCKAGFEVEFSGSTWGDVSIRTSDSGDIGFSASNNTHELALSNAVTLLYTWLTQTAEALKPYGAMMSNPEAPVDE